MKNQIIAQQLKIELYKFYMQVGLSISVFLFSAINLSISVRGSRGNSALYASFLSAVVFFWMPSPGQKKEGDSVAIDSEQTNVFSDTTKQDKN